MLQRSIVLAASFATLLTLVLACHSELPTGPDKSLEASQTVPATDLLLPPDGPAPNPPPILARPFDGLDSFGVAIKAKGDGMIGEDAEPNCVSLTGSGHGTHVGKMTIEQTHCTDGGTVIRSTFSYTGKNGQYISGWYKGSTVSTPTGKEQFEADVAIAEGTIKAVKLPIEVVTDETGTVWNGTLTGTLEDGRFSIELDAWLLHHVSTTMAGPTL